MRKKNNKLKSLAPAATANIKHSPHANLINIKSELISAGSIITYIISRLHQKIARHAPGQQNTQSGKAKQSL